MYNISTRRSTLIQSTIGNLKTENKNEIQEKNNKDLNELFNLLEKFECNSFDTKSFVAEVDNLMKNSALIKGLIEGKVSPTYSITRLFGGDSGTADRYTKIINEVKRQHINSAVSELSSQALDIFSDKGLFNNNTLDKLVCSIDRAHNESTNETVGFSKRQTLKMPAVLALEKIHIRSEEEELALLFALFMRSNVNAIFYNGFDDNTGSHIPRDLDTIKKAFHSWVIAISPNCKEYDKAKCNMIVDLTYSNIYDKPTGEYQFKTFDYKNKVFLSHSYTDIVYKKSSVMLDLVTCKLDRVIESAAVNKLENDMEIVKMEIKENILSIEGKIQELAKLINSTGKNTDVAYTRYTNTAYLILNNFYKEILGYVNQISTLVKTNKWRNDVLKDIGHIIVNTEKTIDTLKEIITKDISDFGKGKVIDALKEITEMEPTTAYTLPILCTFDSPVEIYRNNKEVKEIFNGIAQRMDDNRIPTQKNTTACRTETEQSIGNDQIQNLGYLKNLQDKISKL